LCAVAATGILAIADFVYLGYVGNLPDLRTVWWLSLSIPRGCGAAVTLGCGGAALAKRIVGAAVCGVAVGVLYTAVSAFLGHSSGISMGDIATNGMWRIFAFSIFSVLGAIITEVKLPDPDLK
jgi:MFS family permease